MPVPSPSVTLPVNYGLRERIVAESARAYEAVTARTIEDAGADSAGRLTTGDFEHKVLARAVSLPQAPQFLTALSNLRSAAWMGGAILLLLAVIGGSGAAFATLSTGAGTSVNFFLALGTMLGVHAVALLVWLLLLVLRPKANGMGSLGGLAWSLGRRLNQWLHRDQVQLAVAQAVTRILHYSGAGRWGLSAISHGVWLVFLCTCLLVELLLLSTRQFTFAWETTILSPEVFVSITQGLAVLPAKLGFSVPDVSVIRSSQWSGAPVDVPGNGELWSGLLVGSLVVYGIVPRLLLLVACLWAARRAALGYRLDPAEPDYARLKARLSPNSRSLGVSDPDRGDAPAEFRSYPGDAQDSPEMIPESGSLAILGLEIDVPASGWPPQVGDLSWLDLGMVESREDRARVAELLGREQPRISMVVVVCSLMATPDRGTRRYLRAIGQEAGTPLLLLLTDGNRLRERDSPEVMQQRITDWHQLGEQAGIQSRRVLELDLEHLTALSASKLAGFLGVDADLVDLKSPLDAAFGQIIACAKRWSGRTPDTEEQAHLHTGIARCYQGRGGRWQAMFDTEIGDRLALPEQLNLGAERMLGLLPASLKEDSGWLTSGAIAGALACVAAAVVGAPAAIGALPLWAGLGGGLSVMLRRRFRERDQHAALQEPEQGFSEAVHAAALFALLLELQGRAESEITRALEQVLDAAPPRLADSEEVKLWLERLAARLRKFDDAGGPQ